MNYEKIRNEERKTYQEMIELEKNHGKSEKQIEKYKKYLFLKNIRERLYNSNCEEEPFNFNYTGKKLR